MLGNCPAIDGKLWRVEGPYHTLPFLQGNVWNDLCTTFLFSALEYYGKQRLQWRIGDRLVIAYFLLSFLLPFRK